MANVIVHDSHGNIIATILAMPGTLRSVLSLAKARFPQFNITTEEV